MSILRSAGLTPFNNEILRYTNNAAGDLLSLTDGKNQTTRWKYDEYGRVTNKTDQAGTEILRYKYDPAGRLTNRWSIAKGHTGYAFDAVGNLTLVDYTNSPDVSFGYDALNRKTNMVDAAGTTAYAYTSGGQLWTEDGPFADDTVTNIYNNHLRTRLDLRQPTGSWTNGFGYDAGKRLTSVASPAGSFAYQLPSAQPSALIQKLSFPNTSYITNTYGTVARLTGTYLKKNDHSVLDKYEYVYNAGNQRTQVTRTDASTVGYDYDPIGQLTNANCSVNAEDRGYGYDAAWNLNSRVTNGVAQTFTVDSKNQLSAAIGTNCYYDANGNITNCGSVYYGYDDENRLTSVQVSTNSYTVFAYDGLGRLRARWEGVWQFDGDWGWIFDVNPTVEYIYDGWRVIQERDGGNTPAVSYTRGRDLSGTLEGAGGIGGLLGRTHGYASSNGNWYVHNYYFADGNGNVTYLVNSAQKAAATYRYDPFGNTISSSGSLDAANVYRFSSKEIHVASDLYYYGHRFYSPNLQRWLNRDPLEEYAGLNLYQFVSNDPLSHFDAFGLQRGTGNRPPPPRDSCDPKQRQEIEKTIKDACDRINKGCNDPSCQQVIQKAKKGCLNQPKVRCAKPGDSGCANRECAYTQGGPFMPYEITLCPVAWPSNGSNCPGIGGPITLECTLIHELEHVGAHGNNPDDANTLQKCLGCPQGVPH